MKIFPIIPRHDSTKFTWTGSCGVADASDFGTNEIARAGRFDVISGRTGVVKRFYYDCICRDNEGDVLHHKYLSNPEPSGQYSILIVND